MSDEDQWTRRSLARMVEAGFHFFGVANLEQFEGLLDDAQQRAMLRNWLRSEHVPRGAAAGVADHSTQTAAVTMVSVSTAAATTSGSRLVSVASQASVRVAQRALQASVRVASACIAGERGCAGGKRGCGLQHQYHQHRRDQNCCLGYSDSRGQSLNGANHFEIH